MGRSSRRSCCLGAVLPPVPTSVDGLIMVLLGGKDSFAGPIVDAAIYHSLQSELIRFAEYWRCILGAVIIVLVVAFPDGVAGFAMRNRERPMNIVGRRRRPALKAGELTR